MGRLWFRLIRSRVRIMRWRWGCLLEIFSILGIRDQLILIGLCSFLWLVRWFCAFGYSYYWTRWPKGPEFSSQKKSFLFSLKTMILGSSSISQHQIYPVLTLKLSISLSSSKTNIHTAFGWTTTLLWIDFWAITLTFL